jgi:hypothetical protein
MANYLSALIGLIEKPGTRTYERFCLSDRHRNEVNLSHVQFSLVKVGVHGYMLKVHVTYREQL